MKSKDLIITKNPKSLFAESIRSIRTNIAFASIDNKIKIILNTSPEAGDGKSFVTANLAIAYAQEGKKVLLIDADLRRGRQHDIFGVMNITSGGYTNLMLNYKENMTFEKYIFSPNLDTILHASHNPVIPHSSACLCALDKKPYLYACGVCILITSYLSIVSTPTIPLSDFIIVSIEHTAATPFPFSLHTRILSDIISSDTNGRIASWITTISSDLIIFCNSLIPLYEDS